MLRIRSALATAAGFISVIGSPFVVFTWLIILFVRRAIGDTEHFFYWSTVTLILTSAIPVLFIVWQVRRGNITDAHIVHREQRLSVFFVFVASSLIGALILWWLDAPHSFFVLSLLIALNAIPAGLITTVWKISMHSWVIAAALTIYGLYFGVSQWLLWSALLIVPLIIWSRVYRKRHTLWQGILGAGAGTTITLVLYQLLLR